MKFKNLIGLRTIKTITAVFITLLIDKLISGLDLFIMATTAILSLKSTKHQTLIVGFERILGTIIGGLLSLILIFAKDFIPYYESFSYIIIIPVAILILIIICNQIDRSESIGIASIVFFRVITGISSSQTSELLYVLIRILSSIIGVFISLLLNSISRYEYKEHQHKQ